MAISKDNVKSNFMELSGLDSTSAEVYAGLITVCADEMEKAVDQERMVAEGGTAICGGSGGLLQIYLSEGC